VKISACGIRGGPGVLFTGLTPAPGSLLNNQRHSSPSLPLHDKLMKL